MLSSRDCLSRFLALPLYLAAGGGTAVTHRRRAVDCDLSLFFPFWFHKNDDTTTAKEAVN